MSLFVRVSYLEGCLGSDVPFPSLKGLSLPSYLVMLFLGFVHHLHGKPELFVWLMDMIFPSRSERPML
jgi:hypothetical protein